LNLTARQDEKRNLMKKSELFFSAIQVPLDFLMITLAAVTAFSVRNIPEIMALKPKLYNFPFNEFMGVVFFVMPLFLIIYALEGLYNIRSTRNFWQEAWKVFIATSIGLVFIIVTIFLKREWFSSRFVILAGWIIIVFYVVAARLIVNLIQKWLLRKFSIGVHRVLLIGRNGKLKAVRNIFEKNKNLGYKIIGQLDSPYLKIIKQIKEKTGIDEILLCEPSITDDEQEKLVDYCAINNIVYKYIATTLQTPNIKINVLEGEPIIEVQHTPLDGWGKIIKRGFDIVASIFGIIITAPIMLIVAIAIKLESKGPIIYKNERVGNDGKKFFVYKFRYIKWECCITKENENFNNALKLEKDLIEKQSVRRGPIYKIKSDPRKTRVGSFIEKYSLDELPQFFNVLIGNMSMVGPRPHQEREVNKYMDYHRRLLTIKPGVSGLAQILGRSDLDFEDEYKIDLYYIENWSLSMDISICLKTLPILFRSRKNT
jgi:exopolysaccharide biosynthesis polyprenyl glycosylphosphotransferase